MHIIKLNAIGSTNTFLKDLVRTTVVANHTIVTAESQFAGRGQMGAKWESESGKNLIFSMFIAHVNFELKNAMYLNFAVSLAIYKVLKSYNVPKLAIKWPNDILSDSKKLCGLLIENSITNTKINNSIIGVGLNVNQENFSAGVSKATSLKNTTGRFINKEMLLQDISTTIITEIAGCVPKNFSIILREYFKSLYKYLVPAMFEKSDGTVFMGKIVGVGSTGKIEIELADDSKQFFGLKEIKFLQ